MKDYYEILEVNKKASKEVIDKAYKVLAKKYHPDLQQEDNKINAQKRMQEVNEAYEVLSDENKRKEYDESLEAEEKRKLEDLIKKENFEQQQYEKNQQEYYEDNQQEQYQENYEQNEYINPFSKKAIKEQRKREKEERRRYIEEEERRYRNYLRSMGYKVKEKWTWKRFLRLLKALAIFAVAFLILWIFPPTRNLMKETYNENPIIQTIVDIISKIFVGIFKGIGAFFKQIFSK